MSRAARGPTPGALEMILGLSAFGFIYHLLAGKGNLALV